MVRVTATEASRGFSDLLGRVAAGEEFVVTRAGAPVAIVAPVRQRMMSAERFAEILDGLPPVDADFGEDLRTIRTAAGLAPEDPWAS